MIVAWEMQQMSGTTFVQKARCQRKRKYLPFLIFSKMMTESDVQLTGELGMKNILSMPFDKDKAKQALSEMIEAERNLDKVQKTIRKINSLIESGSPNDAIRLMQEYMNKKGPHYLESKTAQAEVWLHIRKYDRSEKCLNDALSKDHKYMPALQLLAKLYSQTGKHEEAIQTLERLSEASPLNLSLKVGLGSALTEADRTEEAKNIIGEVLDIDEDFQGAKDELGKAAFKDGDMNLATTLLAETENGPELGRFFNNIGIAKIKQGKIEEGIETYHRAVKLLESTDTQHLLKYNLGLAYKKFEKPVEALEWFCRSYLDNPEYEKAYVGLAASFKTVKVKNLKYDKELVSDVKRVRCSHSKRTDKAA